MKKPRNNTNWRDLLPVVYLFAAWWVNHSLGFISLQWPKDSIEAKDAGAAVVVPLVTVLCWLGQKYCLSSGLHNLALVAAHRRRWSANRMERWLTARVKTRLRTALPVITVIAIVIAIIFMWGEGVLHAKTNNPYRAVLFVQALPLWFCILYLMFTITAVSGLTRCHLTSHLNVRLFEVEKLEPLCNSVTINFLMVVALIAVYPINGLFVDMSLTEINLLLIFSGFVLLVFLYPMWLVHRQLMHRKRATLERVNDSLNKQLAPSQPSAEQRRMVDDQQRLQFVSDLLTVRKEVEDAPSWPVSLPFTFKLLVVMAMPLLSWVGAGIVSQMLKGWI